MAQEATKFRTRWEHEGLWKKYIDGKKILDIGCGDDKIISEATGWDLPEGDGQLLRGVADESYDVVFSSHFIEHLRDPLEGLLNQWRVLRDGGHLIFLVPDEDLYEQGVWPSIFNNDHKFTYTVFKDNSWSPASRNIVDLVGYLPNHKLISARIIDTGYDYDTEKIFDQSDVLKAEVCVEVIVQKAPTQVSHQTKLKEVFRCPSCKRMEFICHGVTKENKIEAWCLHCGTVGNLEANIKETV